MAAEDEVRKASDRFYAAINSMVGGKTGTMTNVWSHGAVTAMHPMGERVEGWQQVEQSFDQPASLAGGGHIRLTNQLIRAGTDLAYEVGIEEGEATFAGERIQFRQRVTNIYRREGDEWKMVHHHSDSSPTMNDLVNRLQSQQSKQTERAA